MRTLRLPWAVAGGIAALCHLPLLLLELDLPEPPAIEELALDLETFLPPEPEDAPEPETPPEPPPPEPPPPEPETNPEPPPEPEEPPPDEPPVEDIAPLPAPAPTADPAPDDTPTPTSPTVPVTAEPSDTPPLPKPPPPPPPPPKTPFDPRAYRNRAFSLVDRHKRYPRKARVLGLEGTVKLLLYVGESGELMREPKVHQSSGHEPLDEEAVRMVKAAAPFPKPEGEISRVPILVPLTITFSLQDP